MRDLRTSRWLGEVDRPLIEARIRAGWDARVRGDTDAVLSAFAPDAELTIIGRQSLNHFSGLKIGHAEIRAAIRAIDVDFEFLEFAMLDMLVEGDRAAIRARVRLRNRGTGEVGTLDLFDHIVMRDGLIVSYTQFLDTAKMTQLAGRLDALG